MDKPINLVMPAKEKKIETLKDPICASFLSDLEKAVVVNTLCLCGNSYSLQFFQELSPFLQKIKSINKVILSDIFVSRKEGIVPSLEILNRDLSNKGIVLLDFSYNALCPDGCAVIVDILKTNKDMKYLYLNHVALSQPGTVSICKAVIEGKLDLISFQAIKNRIEIQATWVADMVAGLPNLEELIIFQNNIKGPEMTKLLDSLRNCKKLTHLDISDNYLKPESVDSLVELMGKHVDLRVLKIGDCNIEEEDTEKLVKSLKELEKKSLTTFTYNYNEVGDLDEFVAVLKEFKDLKSFECRGLGLDEEDYEKAQAVVKNVDCAFESDDEDLSEEEDKPVEEKESKDDKIMRLIDEFTHLEFS